LGAYSWEGCGWQGTLSHAFTPRQHHMGNSKQTHALFGVDRNAVKKLERRKWPAGINRAEQ